MLPCLVIILDALLVLRLRSVDERSVKRSKQMDGLLRALYLGETVGLDDQYLVRSDTLRLEVVAYSYLGREVCTTRLCFLRRVSSMRL